MNARGARTILAKLYTTKGDLSLNLRQEQLIDLSIKIQKNNEPVPLIAKIDGTPEQYNVVGILVQGRVFTEYPRIIAVTGKGEKL